MGANGKDCDWDMEWRSEYERHQDKDNICKDLETRKREIIGVQLSFLSLGSPLSWSNVSAAYWSQVVSSPSSNLNGNMLFQMIKTTHEYIC